MSNTILGGGAILAASAVAIAAIVTMGVGGTQKAKTMQKTDKLSAPVVVELFTSEGCSSCPPADDVLARLDKNENVIALGQHVDYWNRLGWSDPFSSAQFSSRQNEYAQAFRSNQVYTPQMVVDGQTEFVGSDENAAQSAIARAGRAPKATVSVRPDTASGKETVRVTVGDLPSATSSADVYFALTERGLQTQVGSGENGGRLLRHAPVVRELRRIGEASAKGEFSQTVPVSVSKAWRRQNLRAVVFVQDKATRHIVGAAQADL